MECAVHGNDAAFTDRGWDIWAVTHWGREHPACDWVWVSSKASSSTQVRYRTRCSAGVLAGHTGSCRGSRLSGQLRRSLLSGGNLVLQVELLRGD